MFTSQSKYLTQKLLQQFPRYTIVQYTLHFKKVPILASCSFDKHGLILIILG